MSQIPKAILLDVDGTLTDRQGLISNQKVKTIKALINKNIIVGVATARSYATLRNYVLPLFSKDSVHLVAGGGQIINRDGKIIWENKIPHNKVFEICQFVEKTKGVFAFGLENTLYCSKSILPKFGNAPWNIFAKSTDKLKNWSTPVIWASGLNSEINRFIEGQKNLNVINNVSKHGYSYFDITNKGVDKGSAVKMWAKINNILPEEILAIGDSLNDLSLLKSVGLGIALEKSPKELKSVAKLVLNETESNDISAFLRRTFNL
jgi:Cof subfamily protein (haloacid dehalogenase superfamily)